MKKIAWFLLVIGGLNWLLVGIFQNDLGTWVLGGMDSIVSRIVYILVGLSAVMMLFKGNCKSCHSGGSASSSMGGGAQSGGDSNM